MDRATLPAEVIGDSGIFDSIDECAAAAQKAQKSLMSQTLEKRKEIIAAMRQAALQNVSLLSNMAWSETGFGRPEDKIKKKTMEATKTPGVEDLESKTFTGDRGMTLVELAPFGVIGSLTPSTNPGSTIINNSISMISAGNAVVYNPHHAAKNVSLRTIEILNVAIEKAGGPPNLLTSIREPNRESGKALMTHPTIDLLVVTGGMGVVGHAMRSGKRVIAGGPGNPPVVVDETADLDLAAREIVNGASFDNNIMCTCEKEAFIVDCVFDGLRSRMKSGQCYELSLREIEQILTVVLVPPTDGEASSSINKKFVGKNAAVIARSAGIDVPEDTRLLICEVGFEHPLVQLEQMMPVFPLVRARDVNHAIEMAIEAEHHFNHSAAMYSMNLRNLSNMASRVGCSLFVKNGPVYASLGMGGEGFTSMTIAGTTGEGVTSARVFSRPRRCTLVDFFHFV